VADDIMDNSITRRGQPCWYRLPKIGLVAINDAIILESCIYRILKMHFRSSPAYVNLVDLFHEVTHQTAHGQLLDTTTAPIGTVDLSRYTLETYLRIVTYKTAFYTFYLPVACGMRLAGVQEEAAYKLAESICVAMGQYFQIQDDYLDCFGDPEVIGKVGTDIEDNKCSWLVVQALDRADERQRGVIERCYGKSDEAAVAEVKAVYRELNLEGLFKSYEQESYDRLVGLIQEQTMLPQGVFLPLLQKIFKRQK
jgi:farnesyl diphosphate synthase